MILKFLLNQFVGYDSFMVGLINDYDLKKSKRVYTPPKTNTMKNIILLKLILILFVIACSKEEIETNTKVDTDLASDNLKGKVRTLNQFQYIAVERFGNI